MLASAFSQTLSSPTGVMRHGRLPSFYDSFSWAKEVSFLLLIILITIFLIVGDLRMNLNGLKIDQCCPLCMTSHAFVHWSSFRDAFVSLTTRSFQCPLCLTSIQVGNFERNGQKGKKMHLSKKGTYFRGWTSLHSTWSPTICATRCKYKRC